MTLQEAIRPIHSSSLYKKRTYFHYHRHPQGLNCFSSTKWFSTNNLILSPFHQLRYLRTISFPSHFYLNQTFKLEPIISDSLLIQTTTKSRATSCTAENEGRRSTYVRSRVAALRNSRQGTPEDERDRSLNSVSGTKLCRLSSWCHATKPDSYKDEPKRHDSDHDSANRCTSKKYYKQFIHCTSGNDLFVARKTGDSVNLVNENLTCVKR